MANLKALILGCVAICANCFGQTPLSCIASGATNTPVRYEGLAEAIGDVIVVCNGGTPTPAGTPVPPVDIKVSLNTSFTNRLLAPYWPDPLLIIDEPAPAAQRVCGTPGDVEHLPGVCRITGTGTGAGVYSGTPGRPNVFQGTLFGSSVLLFTGIPIDPPGTAPSMRIIRITNLRANVNALGIAEGNLPPNAVRATITATPPSDLPITAHATQAVGSVQRGVHAGINPTTPAIFQRDIPQNPGLAADPNSTGVSQFSLRFQELFGTSFKKRNRATSAANPTALASQNDLNIGFFNEETLFYNSLFPSISDHGNLGLAGLSDSGTRLMARFSAIPAGMSLFSQVSGTTPDGSAYRMVNTDVNGAGPYSPVAANSFGIAPIPVLNGEATAVYEVLESFPQLLEDFGIPIFVAYSNQPAPGTATVRFSYAPLSTVTEASVTESVPRFADTAQVWTAFTVTSPPCATLGSSSASFGAPGGAGILPVNATPGCQWTVFSPDYLWVNPGSGQSTNYTVQQNFDPYPRTGRIFVSFADPSIPMQVFTITQAALICSFTVSQLSFAFESAGGSGSVLVTPISNQCTWFSVSNDSWITASSATGIGTAARGFSVAPNLGPARTGTLTIAGQTVTITQSARPNSPPSPVSVSPTNGGGMSSTITYTFSDPDGWQDLTVVNMLLNNFLDGRQACYIAFIASGPTSGAVFLVDNAGNAGGPFQSLAIPGASTNIIANSQCSISAQGSYVSASGNTLTVSLATYFQPSFAGNKVIHVAARDTALHNSGWHALGVSGVWRIVDPIPVGPAVRGVTPGRATTASDTYTFNFTDSNGFTDLTVLNVLVNQFIDGRNGCYVAYVPSGPTTGTLLLVNDNGDAGGPFEAMTIPGTGAIQNSQCTISAAGASAAGSGNSLNLTLPITFSPGFTGSKVIYAAGRSSTQSSGWQAVGSVTVP